MIISLLSSPLHALSIVHPPVFTQPVSQVTNRRHQGGQMHATQCARHPVVLPSDRRVAERNSERQAQT